MRHFMTVIFFISLCNGQVLDLLKRDIINQPIVQAASRITGNTVASVLNFFTTVPMKIGRKLGAYNLFPTLISEHNHVDLTYKVLSEYKAGSTNEDAYLNIVELITKYGRNVEEHSLLTSDGYNLTMHRIPNSGPVVFLMHGLTGSSDDFVIAGPEKGLAYLLSDANYDVWMGNARGNKHSRRHNRMSPSESKFWDFSWHEIGVIDLPTKIDYILMTTGQTQLKYIGHSQGTTTFFVMMSQLPEYNKKVSLMIALSPVVFMSNVRSPIVRMMAAGQPVLQSLSKILGLYEYLPDNTLTRRLREMMCGFGSLAELLCTNTMFLFTGFGFEQLDVENLPVLLGHVPSGSSLKQFVHYGQEVMSGEFRMFDYGTKGNLKVYNNEEPPNYDLGKVTAPVSLFYSDADWLAHPKDVNRLYEKLNNCIDIHKIPREQFNHIDYLFGKDCKTLIFERVLMLLQAF